MATAAQQVLILYIMIAVGFFADKTGLYKEKAARMTNDLLFYIVTPAIITQSFLSMELTAENATAAGLHRLRVCHAWRCDLDLPSLFSRGEP